MSNPTDKELKADKMLLQQLEFFREKQQEGGLSIRQAAEYTRLSHRYYVINEHIRVYWKTY